MKLSIKLPKKLQGAFNTPARYRVLYGGRGSSKSWSVAQMLVIRATQAKTRVLCARELQKSIKDSSLKIIGDTIRRMGLDNQFEIGETFIRHSFNGSEFIFKGIRANPDEIKSTEGIDICWVEEASRISKASLDLLIPTIRVEGSEIWFTFNPDNEEDEVYQRFVVNTPPENSIIIKIDYKDNPWFPSGLESERLYCKENDADNYAHIWEGDCKKIRDGHIYAKELYRARDEKRVVNYPLWDEGNSVRCAWDVGASDATSVWFYQWVGGMIHFIDYYESIGEDPRDLVKMINRKPYNYEKQVLPHDAEHKMWGRDGIKSQRKILEQLGLRNTTVQSVSQSLRDDLHAVRMKFNKCVFDGTKCEEGLKSLKQYHRKYNEERNTFSDTPVHDWSSHGSDAFRYAIIDSYNNTPHVNKPRPIDTQPTFNDLLTQTSTGIGSKRM